MALRFPLAPGEWYHCYNRGVDKRKIFYNKNDYERFLLLMYAGNGSVPIHISNLKDKRLSVVLSDSLLDKGEPLVEIGAYALMPNHFHILIKEAESGGVTSFMQKILTGYTMYFNKKNKRTGPLFAGVFKSKHIADDRYLKKAFSYIHLNPAKLKEPHWKETFRKARTPLKKFVEDYPYSSLGAYISNKHIITNPDKFPNYLASRKEIASHLDDWLYIKGSP